MPHHQRDILNYAITSLVTSATTCLKWLIFGLLLVFFGALKGCGEINDFGRKTPLSSDFNRLTLADGRNRGFFSLPQPNSFKLTEAERRLRQLGWRILAHPKGGGWSARLINKVTRTIDSRPYIPNPKSYYNYLKHSLNSDPRQNYHRILADVDADNWDATRIIKAIGAVRTIEQVRLSVGTRLSQMTVQNQANRSQAKENNRYLFWMCRVLRARHMAYTIAYQRLAMAAPAGYSLKIPPALNVLRLKIQKICASLPVKYRKPT